MPSPLKRQSTVNERSAPDQTFSLAFDFPRRDFLTDGAARPRVNECCLNCGKPLGSRTALCYSCESEGVTLEDAVDVDEALKERVERYLIVASVKCAECDNLHGTVTVDGDEYTAADFGIESVDEWEREMDNEERWMRENRREVEAALAVLEDDWPRSVAAVRNHVL